MRPGGTTDHLYRRFIIVAHSAHLVVTCTHHSIKHSTHNLIVGSLLLRHAMRKRGRPVSVRLSVCHVGVYWWTQTAEDIVKLLSRPGSSIILVFLPGAPVTKCKGNHFTRDAKYTGWENFANFDWNRRLSRKRYDIGPGTLIGNHRRRIDLCQFRWPWVTPNPGFKVTVYLPVEYLNLS